jgi:hypothetical protein
MLAIAASDQSPFNCRRQPLPRRSSASAAIVQLSVGVAGALWLPSQNGGDAVFLQTQNHTCPESAAVYFNGDESLPLCTPSQNGCWLLRPQRHHQ